VVIPRFRSCNPLQDLVGLAFIATVQLGQTPASSSNPAPSSAAAGTPAQHWQCFRTWYLTTGPAGSHAAPHACHATGRLYSAPECPVIRMADHTYQSNCQATHGHDSNLAVKICDSQTGQCKLARNNSRSVMNTTQTDHSAEQAGHLLHPLAQGHWPSCETRVPTPAVLVRVHNKVHHTHTTGPAQHAL
jgi:hypothetical protein